MKFSSVRFRADTGWEMQCPDCHAKHVASWWPLEPRGEWWNPLNLARCRACHLELRRARERGRPRPYQIRYRLDAAEALRVKARQRYATKRDAIRAYQRTYRDAHREQVNARRRALYHERKALRRDAAA